MAGTLAETIDIDCVSDLSLHMPNVAGRLATAHRLARRLQTKRAQIPWWPNFGTDMSEFLGSKAPTWRIANAARLECEKDEQVEQAIVTAELADNGKTLRLKITIIDAEGTFTFTMTLSEAATTLIELQAAG